jgi:hypothetical protein
MSKGVVTVTITPATRRDPGAVEEARWYVDEEGTFRLIHHTTDALIAERKLDGAKPRELSIKLLKDWTQRPYTPDFHRVLKYPPTDWMA